ncbi:M23 family metallopeptidase [Flexithrix dorotheae]|uniref:M23 family metallopeptidase n=1 Tax=Flexithrix dorotheae TaxID=70993 RepID=UPI00037AE265|nr:M23 family metallopeptidase [Flexithrix dorotheae]
MYKAFFYLTFIFFNLSYCFGQSNGNGVYDQSYLFPVKPGQRNYLSGSMGELRSNHFHGGLDIKTDGREGLPIYAARDGYIYRIKVSSYGYGRVLYMQHSDGRRTVYAHLQKFDEAISQYVLENQYAQETFEIELFPKPGMFAFKKGDIIALSGNTGSSGGPHLHFEIREANDAVLNPLEFNYLEIKDNIAPTPFRIAVKTFGKNSRINGKFGREEVSLSRIGRNLYKANSTIVMEGTIGVEFQGTDRANQTSNHYGINKAVLELDGREIYRHEIDSVPFEYSRMINIFTDHERWTTKRQRFQKCYFIDGNMLPFYEDSPGNGFISLHDQDKHELKLSIFDGKNNKTTILIPLTKTSQYSALNAEATHGEIYENVLYLESMQNWLTFHLGDFNYQLRPDYKKGNQYVYLWDMRLGMPDSIMENGLKLDHHFKYTFYPNTTTTFFDSLADITVPYGAINDTLYLSTWNENGEFRVNNIYTPLFHPITFRYKPDTLALGKNYKNLKVYYIDERNSKNYRGGNWVNGEIEFKTMALGRFRLLEDNVIPSIRVINRSPYYLRFTIHDSLSGIDKYELRVNGEWVLMNYDHRKNVIWSELLDKKKPLKGPLELKVWDKAGNMRTYKSRL